MIRDHRKTFGIDIDGVLADVEALFDGLAMQYTGKPWPRDYRPDTTAEVAPVAEDALWQILDDFYEHCIPELDLLPGVREALDALKPRYRLVIITARRPASEPLTRQWLERSALPFDALYHVENKAEVPEPLSFAIDDHPRHIMRYLDRGIPCFVMDYPRNRHLDPHPHLTRVQGWSEVLDRLLN